MMTETLRWIETSTTGRESTTAICVEVDGEAAEKLREHYDQKGEVVVVHTLALRDERFTWSARLWIGGEIVHKEPGEVTVTEHSTVGGDDEWLTHLTGGHRMIRHLIGLVG